MDLTEKYQALVSGATLVAESAEEAYRLGALDRFLKPSIRASLDWLGGLFASCDTSRQLAGDTRALARVAADYSELRKELFSDLHHTRPEPPWRTVSRGKIGIRAQSLVLDTQPTFVLRRLDAGLNVPGAATWEFVVIAKPSDPADQGTTLVVMVSADDQQTEATVTVSKDLESHGAWYKQLGYGFYSLGIRPHLTSLRDPDRHLRLPIDDGEDL